MQTKKKANRTTIKTKWGGGRSEVKLMMDMRWRDNGMISCGSVHSGRGQGPTKLYLLKQSNSMF